jgi:hypothetical protein
MYVAAAAAQSAQMHQASFQDDCTYGCKLDKQDTKVLHHMLLKPAAIPTARTIAAG